MAVIISYHQQSTFISLVVIYKALETKEAYVHVESDMKKRQKAANHFMCYYLHTYHVFSVFLFRITNLNPFLTNKVPNTYVRRPIVFPSPTPTY